MNEMTPQECAEEIERFTAEIESDKDPAEYSSKTVYAWDYAAAVMRKLVSGELVEVVHAHWKIIEHSYFCSACGDENNESTEYCPCCGANMDEKDDNNATD